ncbi:MAG: hypothetical protein MZV63_55990 [Marinilabiliales bacterium]|nr:hypothetical protein [Marinilabiliales bacterium]
MATEAGIPYCGYVNSNVVTITVQSVPQPGAIAAEPGDLRKHGTGPSDRRQPTERVPVLSPMSGNTPSPMVQAGC